MAARLDGVSELLHPVDEPPVGGAVRARDRDAPVEGRCLDCGLGPVAHVDQRRLDRAAGRVRQRDGFELPLDGAVRPVDSDGQVRPAPYPALGRELLDRGGPRQCHVRQLRRPVFAGRAAEPVRDLRDAAEETPRERVGERPARERPHQRVRVVLVEHIGRKGGVRHRFRVRGPAAPAWSRVAPNRSRQRRRVDWQSSWGRDWRVTVEYGDLTGKLVFIRRVEETAAKNRELRRNQSSSFEVSGSDSSSVKPADSSIRCLASGSNCASMSWNRETKESSWWLSVSWPR